VSLSQVLDTSGILALTFCGLLLSARGMSHVSAGAKQHVDFFWWACGGWAAHSPWT
jgi:NhaP-type Na+/H+ and K+/H+ antiporter